MIEITDQDPLIPEVSELDREWELAKVDCLARDTNYRHRLAASRSFEFAEFNKKNIDDELRWILLQLYK